LYRFSKSIRDRLGLTWEKFFARALTVPFIPGLKYEDNFRKGNIAKSKAAQIAGWIEKNDPEIAAELESAVYARRVEAGEFHENLWQQLIGDRAQTGSVKVLPYKKSSLGLVEFATPEALAEVKLGAQFYFQVSVPCKGNLWGFEGYEGQWYPMALQRGAAKLSVTRGAVNVPSKDEGKNIEPVCENKDLGRHEFAFVFVTGKSSPDEFSDLQIGQRQSTHRLNRIAGNLMGIKDQAWRLFHCSIMVRA